MRVEKKNKAFAYRVPIGDYNYLQCRIDAKHSAIIINCLADGKQLTVANYI